MGIYNKLFCASIVLTFIALVVLVFALFIFQVLIKSEAKSSAVLAANNADLWATLPGRSKVNIIRDQYFYDIQNINDIFNNKAPASVQEKGPYRHYENQQLINLNFTNNSDVVNYNFFKYFLAASN